MHTEVDNKELKRTQDEFDEIGKRAEKAGEKVNKASGRRARIGLSDEEIEEASRHIDELLAKKKELAEATDVAMDGPIREEAPFDHDRAREEGAAVEAQINAYLAERGNLSEKEAAARERALEKERKQQALEEERLRKQQALEDEERRLQGIRESAIVSDRLMVEMQQEKAILQERLNELKGAGLGYGHKEYDDVTARLKEINAEVRKYQSGLKGAAGMGAKVFVPNDAGAVSAVNKDVNLLKEGFKKAGNAAKECFHSMDDHCRKSSGMLGKVGNRFKGLLLSLMVFNQVSKAFRGMVSAMQEGFKNLAQYSADYNGAMSALKSETATLKNGLAAAFEPIVTAVIPYVTQLVGWLNRAVDAMGQFLAALSGKGTYTRAKAQVIDYAKSLETATRAAKGALASFDDVNVLQEDSRTEDAGGEVTGGAAFETVEIDGGIREVVDSLRPFMDIFDEWMAGLDFTALLASLNSLKEACEPFVGYLGDGISWFLSDVLGPIGTWTVNEALPKFIDTLTEGITFLDEAFQTIKPSLEYVWDELLAPIGSYVADTFLWTLDRMKEAFASLTTLFQEKGDKINNILKGITNVLKVLWLFGVKPVIEFIKGAVTGLGRHIDDIIGDVIDVLDGVVTFLTGVFKGDWKEAWEGLKGVFKGIIDGIREIFQGLIDFFVWGLEGLAKCLGIELDLSPLKLAPVDGMDGIILPRLVTGGVVTQSVLANAVTIGQEVASPFNGNEEWMDELAERVGIREVNVRFEGSLSELGRVLKPVIDAEGRRVGRDFRKY